MKTLLLLITLFAMPTVISAQTVADSQRQATTKYPALVHQGSPLHTKFLALYNEAKQSNPALLKDPNWPMILADRAAGPDGPPPPQQQPPPPPQPIRAAPSAGTFEEVKSPFEPKLKNTEEVFDDFVAKGDPKPRDQFETREEYETRLPKPFDNSEVFYFEVTLETSYSYDIDKQRLTLVAGKLKSPGYHKYKLTDLVPLSIHRKYEDKGTYEASNSYGKTVTVKKTYVQEYYLHLTNGKSLPAALKIPSKESYDKSEQLSLSISLPRDQAKELAPRLGLICGVRFIAYPRSVHECTLSGKATITNPSELAVFAKGIDAQIVSIHVINKQSKEELARWKQ